MNTKEKRLKIPRWFGEVSDFVASAAEHDPYIKVRILSRMAVAWGVIKGRGRVRPKAHTAQTAQSESER